MTQQVYVFDFDGTLTRRDTLLAFICHARGAAALLWGLLRHGWMLVRMKLGHYPNGRAKERLFAYFFRGMPLEAFDDCCRHFCLQGTHLLRPQGMATLRQAVGQGARVYVVSASIDRWVAPFFQSVAGVTVVGTQVEVQDGRLTGRFATPNCYGGEKVRRLQAVLPLPRTDCHIIAYGDSRGDNELFAYADETHYKPFR